jgi:hypothetical protein
VVGTEGLVVVAYCGREEFRYGGEKRLVTMYQTRDFSHMVRSICTICVVNAQHGLDPEEPWGIISSAGRARARATHWSSVFWSFLSAALKALAISLKVLGEELVDGGGR